MYHKKYYEINPNMESITNQSNSFYYPPMIPISDYLDVEYDYDDISIDDSFYKVNDKLVDVHKLLDYTLLSDESCMNIMFLFSKLPVDDKRKDNIVQFIKSEGIVPNLRKKGNNIQ